jgi:hypothetical protein
MNYSTLSPKDPADVLNPLTFDFSLVLPNGAALTGTPSVSATPSGLTLGAAAVSASNPAQVCFQCAGGTAGTTYAVRVTVSDTAGNTWNRTAQLCVQNL